MKLKTKKSLSKRIKVSKGGKITIRTGGQGHFNSRESSKITKNKRRNKNLSSANIKNVKKLLPYL
tara:strand:+ start:280 stop:474 length:195 start_codon:yes stop_codon:yes gene_type:complete